MTALFIVIFASLLLSIMTVGFISIITSDQQRSTDDEQSQSAYDAALAGVEDGKRVLSACQDGDLAACQAIRRGDCNTVQASGVEGAPTDDEVVLKSTVFGDGSQLNQAYTCVVINEDTPDYLATISADESILVPLRSNQYFSKVAISWYTEKDAVAPRPVNAIPALPSLSEWLPVGRPPLLRTQLVQYNDGTILPSNFDANDYAHTLYLYPTTQVSALAFGYDVRRVGSLDLQRARCSDGSFPLLGYACQAVIDLPGNNTSFAQRAGFLRLTSIYSGTHVRVQLQNDSGDVVDFAGIQPAIDSTGRANDLFRRVEARVENTTPDFPFPRATIDITNNFCKDFALTEDPVDYRQNCQADRSG
ncbi:hypothetical protein CR983_00535 [Candidatus Saccharibacteria bacterium]|nr:MAG: hypothetical protein CR983_00535 [Candidatus Saccharibacteria bacterium]